MDELTGLKRWLDDMFIPSSEKSNIPFLSIAGLDHYENVWSNIYAYFLTEKENHGLGRIFLKALRNIFQTRNLELPLFKNLVVEREVPTNKNNRIDLLLREDDNSFAIIIENKVYHSLQNDLSDYWESITANDKKGIVLTLFPMALTNSNFVNITHLEWINSTLNQINDEKFELSSATRVFLFDFFRTIKKHSMEINSDIREFYNSNRVKINEVSKIAEDSKKWLKRLFLDENLAHSYGFEIVHTDRITAENRYVMYKFPYTDEFVITIFYENLWNSESGNAKLRLFLETQGPWFKLIRGKAKENEIFSYLQNYKELSPNFYYTHPYQHKGFWHFAILDIPITEDELLHSRIIRTKLENCIKPDSSFIILAHKLIELIKA